MMLTTTRAMSTFIASKIPQCAIFIMSHNIFLAFARHLHTLCPPLAQKMAGSPLLSFNSPSTFGPKSAPRLKQLIRTHQHTHTHFLKSQPLRLPNDVGGWWWRRQWVGQRLVASHQLQSSTTAARTSASLILL